MKSWKKALVGLAGLAAAVVAPQSSFASEPLDNSPGWGSLLFAGDVSLYECGVAPGCSFSHSDSINSNTDQDWVYVTCGNGKVTQVNITLANSPYSGSGDLDIDVYKPTSSLVGGSHGSGSVESVNTTAANLSSLILNVYGYHPSGGSTFGQNGYTIDIKCSS